MPARTRVLILDENLDSRVDARKALQRGDFDIVGEVGFGAEALTIANETRPDIVLISVEEPVTRALETAESLANLLPQTPFIFYASISTGEAVRRAVLFGARDYLTKPLQAKPLADAIARAMEFEERRQMRQAGQLAGTAVRGTVITVTGAKGGIGKSVISVNLAAALRQRTNGKVVIFDADTHFGDVATMFDVTPEASADEMLKEVDQLNRATITNYQVAIDPQLSLLPGPQAYDAWDNAGPEAGRKIIDLLAATNDFVIIDTSGAMDRFVKAVVEASTLVLLVTTGEVSSVRDTKGALRRLDEWEIPLDKVKIVLNRGARAEGFQVSDLEKTFSQRVFWEMPRDKDVALSVQVGRPFVIEKPNSSASRHIFALAATIGGNAHVNGQTPDKDGRAFSLFRGRETKVTS